MDTLPLLWLSFLYFSYAARIDLRQGHQGALTSQSDDSVSKGRCPKWLCTDLLGFLFDVKVYHKFPDEHKMMTKLQHVEDRILKLRGEAKLWADTTLEAGIAAEDRMVFSEMDEDTTEEDLSEEYGKLKYRGDLQTAINTFTVPHEDQCVKNSTFPAAKTPKEIFDNIKAVVDTFNIFTKCTKAYIRRHVDGKPKIEKDDVIAIATEIASGVFVRSFEDISQYQEYVDSEGVRHLVVIVSSRKENVIEGNYDVVLRQYPDHVDLQYTKRQNLAEPVLRRGITRKGYAIVTQQSVDRTIRKLAYAGLYGPAAIEFGTGCMKQDYCVDYEIKKIGEKCKYSMQCESHSCKRTGFGRKRKCIERTSGDDSDFD